MRNRRSRSGRNPRNGTLVFIEEKLSVGATKCSNL
ncbi:hypothetical protein HFN76_30425 [Rhizobium laguerreae]|nr:hypothetical protein [Rhizobium laguerreae]